MSPFQRLGSALDALWSALDPDEPLLCDCRNNLICPDCSLSVHIEDEPGWPHAAALPAVPAA